MLVVYLYPDGTAESERATTAVYDAIGDTQKKSRAVVVLTLDEYSGQVKVIKDRYGVTQGLEIKTHDDIRNETFDLADRALVQREGKIEEVTPETLGKVHYPTNREILDTEELERKRHLIDNARPASMSDVDDDFS
jgi:hypothetical protein